MKRKEHEAEVRRRITKAARRLFQEQGFNQTTIRQIIQLAEVKTGTLYHFYQDKEHIFSSIVRDVFYRVLEITNELVPNPEDRALRLACELSYHIHSMMLDARTAELYVVTYNSALISKITLQNQVDRSKELFTATHPQFSDAEHEVRAMFVRGFLQSLALRVASGEAIDTVWVIEQATSLTLRLYDVPIAEIDAALVALSGLKVEERVKEALKVAL